MSELEGWPDPASLVQGAPGPIVADADVLNRLAGTVESLVDVAYGADVGDWSGDAADAYANAIHETRLKALKLSDSFREAASALKSHAWTLEWAIGQADLAVAKYNAPSAAPVTPGVMTPAQAAAHDIMNAAHDGVRQSATRTARVLRDLADLLPYRPTFWNHLGHHWAELVGGTAEAGKDLIVFAWDMNVASLILDPSGWGAHKQQLLAGLGTALTDPVAFGKGVTDWDTWMTSPARAIGHLVPDALIGIATAGSGAVAVRGSRAVANAAARSVDDVAETAAGAATRRADDAAEGVLDATGRRQYTADELATPTPGDGPVIFRVKDSMTSEEVGQMLDYVDEGNRVRLEGGLSETGRVSTEGDLRRAANAEASLERARASAAGSPYQGVAGHLPDPTWTNRPGSEKWADETITVNSSLGGQAGHYPVGYKPTVFELVERSAGNPVIRLPDGAPAIQLPDGSRVAR
ncbi:MULTISPECIES: WXG100 family type VII secretion target [unclassified Actinotalea]|uniref:WXG100 family type VII secretion target n=1 Tax=unclassified Actinotalea TaxID=2638618 RepID=UPI0015F609B2|nr:MULTISPECIES: hypothetical protein [unclassified Actinotalea]